MNNQSCLRIALNIFKTLAPSIPAENYKDVFVFFQGMCQNSHYELRISAVQAFAQLAKGAFLTAASEG